MMDKTGQLGLLAVGELADALEKAGKGDLEVLLSAADPFETGVQEWFEARRRKG
jgi:hypothetical protein